MRRIRKKKIAIKKTSPRFDERKLMEMYKCVKQQIRLSLKQGKRIIFVEESTFTFETVQTKLFTKKRTHF